MKEGNGRAELGVVPMKFHMSQRLAGAAMTLLLIAGSAVAEDAKKLPVVKGEIVKVDESAGKITIKHDAIPNLSMDAMTMVFKASDPALLTTVKTGEKVNFTADLVNGQLNVLTIDERK
jgi:Cu(I)/Ag(I) efflux system periplasmic protein CusF